MSKYSPTVWEALNEPVVEITEEQAKKVILASVIIISAAWIAPYWGSVGANTYALAPQERTIFEQTAMADADRGQVAGAVIEAPEWYYVVAGMPQAVAQSFSEGANDILDISGPASNIAAFYEPGVSGVWNGWLELMADP